MASVELSLNVPADYVGYTAIKMALREIVEAGNESPFDAGKQESAELAGRVLDFVEEMEAEGP